MHKTTFILLFLLALISCSKEYEIPEIKKEDKILAFGDSLTFGYGAPKNKSYPAALSSLIDRNVINAGINGETTADGLKRFGETVYNEQPKLVILSLGGNDMLKRVPIEETRNNLKEMISLMQKRKISIVLLAEPRPSIGGAALGLSDASFYKEIADEYKIPVIENVFSKWLSDEEYKSDYIHLNEKGYQKVAEDISLFLKKSKAITDIQSNQPISNP